VLKFVEGMEKDKLVTLKDAAIVVKDESGELMIKETEDFSILRGVATRGTLGLIIGIVVGGLVLDGAVGALMAKMADLGVSNKIEAVTSEMKDGTSALFHQIESVKEKEWLIALVLDSGGKVVEIVFSYGAEVDMGKYYSNYTARHQTIICTQILNFPEKRQILGKWKWANS